MKKRDEKMSLEKSIHYGSKDAVIRNLKDAGCCQEMVQSFMTYLEQGNLKGQLELLEKRRDCLLEQVHEEEKQIDCLDYLVYQIRRNETVSSI